MSDDNAATGADEERIAARAGRVHAVLHRITTEAVLAGDEGTLKLTEDVLLRVRKAQKEAAGTEVNASQLAQAVLLAREVALESDD